MVMRVHGERLIQAESLLVCEANESASDRKIVPTTAVRQARKMTRPCVRHQRRLAVRPTSCPDRGLRGIGWRNPRTWGTELMSDTVLAGLDAHKTTPLGISFEPRPQPSACLARRFNVCRGACLAMAANKAARRIDAALSALVDCTSFRPSRVATGASGLYPLRS
jgi:hypothetical protein